MVTLRLGLVGLGHWGRVCLGAIQALAPALSVTALASSRPENAALLPSGCRLYADWRALVLSDECDAVVIASPTSTHVPIALAALRQGKPVFIEKPLCFDVDAAVELRALVIASGLPVLIDHIHLFNPAFRRLQELASGLGPVLAIDAVAGKPAPPKSETPAWWDWGAHDVAMCLRLIGRLPDRVDVAVRPVSLGTGTVGEIVDAQLDFGDLRASMHLGSLPQRRRRLTVTCRDGVLVYDDLADEKLTLNDQAQPVAVARPLDMALLEFRRRVMEKAVDLAELDLAIDVVRVLTAGQAFSGSARVS